MYGPPCSFELCRFTASAAGWVVAQLAADQVLLVAQRVVQHRERALRLRRQHEAGQQARLGEPAPQERRLEALRRQQIAGHEGEHPARQHVRQREQRAPHLQKRPHIRQRRGHNNCWDTDEHLMPGDAGRNRCTAFHAVALVRKGCSQ